MLEIDKHDGTILEQRKRADDLDIRFYTNEQLIQFMNTVHCHIQFMDKYGPYFCFDRNSSMPLEHKFGLTRIGCKDINTLSQFVKTLADVEKYAPAFRNINEHTKVNGRRNAFGITVSDFSCIEMNEFSTADFNPEEVALATLHLASFDCQGNNDAHEVISWFFHVVKSLDSTIEKSKSKSKKSATSNSLLIGTKANIRSRFLIQNQNTIFPSSLNEQIYFFLLRNNKLRNDEVKILNFYLKNTNLKNFC